MKIWEKWWFWLIIILIVVAIGFLINKISPVGCAYQYNQINKEMLSANYCSIDSDCKVLPLGGRYVEFGCYHYINKNVDENEILREVETYWNKCSQTIDDCMNAPEAKCVNRKCAEKNNDNNASNQPDCNKDSDCSCSFSCGCVPQEMKETLCRLLPKERVCKDKGCQCVNNKCTVNLTINTKEKAIEFAKNDADFVQASNKYKSYFKTELIYNAYLDDKKMSWHVSVWPNNTQDAWYFINFYPNGTIIEKGYWIGD